MMYRLLFFNIKMREFQMDFASWRAEPELFVHTAAVMESSYHHMSIMIFDSHVTSSQPYKVAKGGSAKNKADHRTHSGS